MIFSMITAFSLVTTGELGYNRKLSVKLLPLADSHLQLINIAYNVEKNLGYKSKEKARLKLAILSRDISIVNEGILSYQVLLLQIDDRKAVGSPVGFGRFSVNKPCTS